jgi:hypothetical protein
MLNFRTCRFAGESFAKFRGDLRVRHRPVGDHLADMGLRRLRIRGLPVLPPRARLEPAGALEQAVTARRLPPHPVEANVSDSTQIADLTLEIEILVEL